MYEVAFLCSRASISEVIISEAEPTRTSKEAVAARRGDDRSRPPPRQTNRRLGSLGPSGDPQPPADGLLYRWRQGSRFAILGRAQLPGEDEGNPFEYEQERRAHLYSRLGSVWVNSRRKNSRQCPRRGLGRGDFLLVASRTFGIDVLMWRTNVEMPLLVGSNVRLPSR